MRWMRIGTSLLALMILFSACEKQDNSAEEITKAKLEIDSLYQAWCHSYCAHDLDQWLEPVAYDAVFLCWPEKLVTGKPLIEQCARKRFQRREMMTIQPELIRDGWQIHIRGEVAWVESWTTVVYKTNAGDQEQRMLESLVFEKREGRWWIMQYHRTENASPMDRHFQSGMFEN